MESQNRQRDEDLLPLCLQRLEIEEDEKAFNRELERLRNEPLDWSDPDE